MKITLLVVIIVAIMAATFGCSQLASTVTVTRDVVNPAATATVTVTQTPAAANGAPSKLSQLSSTTTIPANVGTKSITGELYAAFRLDAVAASLQYQGKSVTVLGKIAYIEKGLKDGWIVTLYEFAAYNIECSFDASAGEQVAKLSKGQAVLIQGICDGAAPFGDPKLIHCKVVN